MARFFNLNSIQYFEAVARHSRVSLAAEELSVSTSAVSQQIRSLETALGVPLFRRLKRRLVLTEEGERLYLSANEALRLLHGTHDRITRRHKSTSLILRVSISFGVSWLGPRIAGFIDANPRWNMHIDGTQAITDFEKEAVDLDVRYGLGEWRGLYVEPIVDDIVLPLCRPGYPSTARADSGSLERLGQVRLIHTVQARVGWSRWLRHHGFDRIDTSGGLRFDRSFMALQGARDGVGVALESATLAVDDLRSGALVPMFPMLGGIRFPAYWLVCPSRHLSRRAVQVFRDWLHAEAAEHAIQKKRLLASLGCVDIRDVAIELGADGRASLADPEPVVRLP